MNTIDYSEHFRFSAIKVFPEWKQLHDAINNNESDSVRIELGSIPIQIEPDEIIVAFNEGRLKQLYERAKRLIKIRELENMWYDEFDRSQEEIINRNQINIG